MSMVKLLKDPDNRVIRIEKDGVTIFEGNYEDLPRDPDSFADLISKIGLKAEVKEYSCCVNEFTHYLMKSKLRWKLT